MTINLVDVNKLKCEVNLSQQEDDQRSMPLIIGRWNIMESCHGKLVSLLD